MMASVWKNVELCEINHEKKFSDRENGYFPTFIAWENERKIPKIKLWKLLQVLLYFNFIHVWYTQTNRKNRMMGRKIECWQWSRAEHFSSRRADQCAVKKRVRNAKSHEIKKYFVPVLQWENGEFFHGKFNSFKEFFVVL